MDTKTNEQTLGDQIGQVSFKTKKFQTTISGKLDFSQVTKSEIETFLSSTTSALKMVQNNILPNDSIAFEKWNEQFEQDNNIISIRSMLDNRQSKMVSDEEKLRRVVKKLKEKGFTNEQIMAELTG